MELFPVETYPIDTFGVFPDHRRTDLNKSIYTAFKSTAPGVATVDKDGAVTGVAPGTAKIIVTYRNMRTEVSVHVVPSR